MIPIVHVLIITYVRIIIIVRWRYVYAVNKCGSFVVFVFIVYTVYKYTACPSQRRVGPRQSRFVVPVQFQCTSSEPRRAAGNAER